MPRGVIEYLSNKQTAITSLSITTDMTCMREDPSIQNLMGFSQLRQISWTVNTTPENLEVLRKILRCSATYLRDITIGFGTRDSEYCLFPSRNRSVKDVLHAPSEIRSRLFPALKRLTLSDVPLEHRLEDIISAFGIGQVQFLKLQDCLGTNKMLRVLARSPQPLLITSFELKFTGAFDEQYDISPLIEFYCPSKA